MRRGLCLCSDPQFPESHRQEHPGLTCKPPPQFTVLAVTFPGQRLSWHNGADTKHFLCVKVNEDVWISSSGPPMEMKTLSALLALLLIFGAVVTDGNLFDLQKMIKQVTGRSAITNYIAYGCYCGNKGRGKPLDATDWCCHDHDCCYRRGMRCKPKTERYSYTYLSGNVKCDGGTQCQREICECDRNFVLCLKKNLGSYKSSYRYYSNIFCRGSPPGC
ncbi:UNVERIFIED_CONTAM: hypothetical protein K2H54_016884 [Gekko kuhli]